MERCFAEDAQSKLRLFSLSQQFLLDRAGYYHQLQKASKPVNSATALDITDWINGFLGCYRELTDLVAQGLLAISGQGRGTRYAVCAYLALPLVTSMHD